MKWRVYSLPTSIPDFDAEYLSRIDVGCTREVERVENKYQTRKEAPRQVEEDGHL